MNLSSKPAAALKMPEIPMSVLMVQQEVPG
jgi:hypothetical protein